MEVFYFCDRVTNADVVLSFDWQAARCFFSRSGTVGNFRGVPVGCRYLVEIIKGFKPKNFQESGLAILYGCRAR
jgi:hypothetical protein